MSFFLFCWYLRESFNSFPFQSHLKQLWYGHHPRSLLTLSWLGAFCKWALVHIHKQSNQMKILTFKENRENEGFDITVVRVANQTKMFKNSMPLDFFWLFRVLHTVLKLKCEISAPLVALNGTACFQNTPLFCYWLDKTDSPTSNSHHWLSCCQTCEMFW